MSSPPATPPNGMGADPSMPSSPGPDGTAPPQFGALEQALASATAPRQVSLNVASPPPPPTIDLPGSPLPEAAPQPHVTPQPQAHVAPPPQPQPAPQAQVAPQAHVAPQADVAPQPHVAPQPQPQPVAPQAPVSTPPASQTVSAPAPGAADPYQPSAHLQAQQPGAPSLPSVAPATPTPTGATPVANTAGIEGAFTAAQMAAVSAGGAANATIGGPSMAVRLARMLMLAAVAACVGLGAQLALQWNEDRTESEDANAATADADGAALDGASIFQPIGEPLPTTLLDDPSGRYLATSTTRTVDGTTTVRSFTFDLATGDLEGNVTHPNGDGTDYAVQATGQQVQYRSTEDPNWVDAAELADRAFVDEVVSTARGTNVHTLTELVPPSLVPHVLVVQERDEPLAVSPLGTASGGELTVRYYQLQFDFPAWAREHPHEAHSHPFLGETASNLEVWVDGAGVVRRYQVTPLGESSEASAYVLDSLTDVATSPSDPAVADAGSPDAPLTQEQIDQRVSELLDTSEVSGG